MASLDPEDFRFPSTPGYKSWRAELLAAAKQGRQVVTVSSDEDEEMEKKKEKKAKVEPFDYTAAGRAQGEWYRFVDKHTAMLYVLKHKLYIID